MPQARRKPAGDPDAAAGAETTEQPVASAPEDAAVSRGDPGRWRRLLRLAVIGVVAAGILATAIIAVPILYARYVAPIGENTADVNELRSQVADLRAEVEAVLEAQAAADARVGVLEDRVDEQIAEHARRLSTLEEMDRSLAADVRAGQSEWAREVRLLKAMELMSRARLFLYQSNFGLAAQDLEAARSLLLDLEEGTASTDAATIEATIDRLDRALAALPEFPVVASDDVDIAWQALLGNVPSPTPEAAATPTPTPAATPSPSADASP